MRLINTIRLSFSEFYGSNIPKYAILSHTWGTEEITYNEWLSRDKDCLAKEGYKKIYGACKQAAKDGWDWLWVDTNCIDKSSSAELTEAINSMYQWYERSQVCYAYLADVSVYTSQRKFRHHFKTSRWFTRGWTLQELLAPQRLTFYFKEWLILGDRSASLVSEMIAEATGIDARYLEGHLDISSASVARRMSWLSHRRTTREEDIAYCMLGIFGINMPLLYGEGSRAFTRLQEEIIKTSHDHSLFCWTFSEKTPEDWRSILAPSPEEFKGSQNYVPKETTESLTPYTMTNLGLSIQLPVIHTFSHPFVLLNAGLIRHPLDHRACLAMRYNSSVTSVSDSMLIRHWFPDGPIILTPFNATLMRRHHLHIFARPTVTPRRPIGYKPSMKGANVLIVMQPTKSTLFRGSETAFRNPENSGFEVLYVRPPSSDTHPPNMFDHTRSILHLPIVKEIPGRVNACVMSVFYPDEPGRLYFLFFGCRNYGDNKAEWGCRIMAIMANPHLRRRDDMEHLLWDFLNSDFAGRTGRRSKVSNASLVLELGASVPSGQNQRLKIATLRGPKQKSINMVDSDTDSDVESDEDSDEDSGEGVNDVDSNCAIAGD